jgi:hypothetical protein
MWQTSWGVQIENGIESMEAKLKTLSTQDRPKTREKAQVEWH